jgi:hypothetical protein
MWLRTAGGTGLAPLLFILFITDLIKNLNHLELRLFADDF